MSKKKTRSNLLADSALEMSVLGALIMQSSPRSATLELLSPEMFFTPAWRIVYETIEKMVLDNKPIDLVTLKNELDLAGHLGEVGGPAALASLVEGVPNIEAAEEYARRLSKITLRRRLAAALQNTLTGITEGSEENLDPGRIYDNLARAAGLSTMERTLWWMRDLLSDFNPEVHKTAAQQGVPSSGIAKLDEAMTIFKPSNFTVIAGRPGLGKSTLMRQIALEAAKSGPILIFTLEESMEAVRDKMLCVLAGVSYYRWYNGHTTSEEEKRLVIETGNLANLPIAFYGGYSCDASKVRLAIRRMTDEGKRPVAVFIDHLQLMYHPKAENRDQAVGETSSPRTWG